MRNSCAVCLLAIALCLFVCDSVNTEVSQTDATKEVTEAKAAVTTLCARAQDQLDNANLLLRKVESSKSGSAETALKSQKTATGNTDAEAIATEVKSLSDAVAKSYLEVKEKLNTAVGSLTALLAAAKDLEGQSTIAITPNAENENDYTETNGKASALKVKATELDGRIDTALEPISGVDDIANEMANKAKEAQLKDSQVSAIVAVAKIVGMLGKADDIIGQIDGKKNTVNEIVDEMKALKTNPPVVPDENINALLQSAEDALREVTGAVDSAQSAKVEITKQKELANTALANVKGKNQEVNDALSDANTAEACVRAAEKIVQQLETALQTADNCLTSATAFKQQLQKALSKATSKPDTEQSVTNPQMKTLQDSVSAAVNAIQTIMQEAEGALQRTQNHKEEVNNIVEEMKKHCTTDLIQSYDIIKEQCQRANDALTSAKGAVEKAKSAKGEIEQQKGLADAALEKVQQKETDVTQAEHEADAAKKCVTAAELYVEQLNNALQEAETSLTNANDLKQKLKTALSTTTTAPSTVQATETAKANPPVEQGTEPSQKDTTIQPTSKESPDQTNSSAAKLKDALSNGVQNVSTTALTGGKAPAPGANNDSAMNVSVPLLVALIASAVLQ